MSFGAPAQAVETAAPGAGPTDPAWAAGNTWADSPAYIDTAYSILHPVIQHGLSTAVPSIYDAPVKDADNMSVQC